MKREGTVVEGELVPGRDGRLGVISA